MKVPRNEVVRTALRPASAVWEVLSRSRNLMYDRGIARIRRLPVPVVSVGNITVGGTGKSPTTIELARRLIAAGLRPLVLSRGYGSKGYGTRVVSDGEQIALGPDEAGDEPVMIAASVRGLPVVVDPDRVRGGLAAVRRFSPDLILLDDGFQHRRLARDLDIVLLDAVDPFGRYALLPSGFLREPFSGLARADVFLVTHAPPDEALGTLTSVVRRYNTRAPILRAIHRAESLAPVGGYVAGVAGAGSPRQPAGRPSPDASRSEPSIADEGPTAPQPLKMLDGAPVFAFCGIGNPEGFRATLLESGARLVGFRAFPDHHRFTSGEIQEIRAAAARTRGISVVTTEKDAVRIAQAPEVASFLALRIRMEIPEVGPLIDQIAALVRPR